MAKMNSQDYINRTNELYAQIESVTDENERIILRNKVVVLNMPLVSQVLKKYKPYNEDNFQDGCLGLISAAETYQTVRGVPFNAFACFCIERSLQLAHKIRQETIEGQLKNNFVYLDGVSTTGNGDELDTSELFWDEQASRELEFYIDENELRYVCDTIIKPSIAEIVERGKHMPTKIDISLWQELEFAYIMDLVFIDSQKQRFTLTQLAKQVNGSIQNIRTRHNRVMEIIFQRMWDYMSLSFNEMLQRLRGGANIPQRLLCLDPGMTTGWCLFEDGKLTLTGHLENCYNNQNVNIKPLMALMQEHNPDFIVYEDYKVYGHKVNRHINNPVHTVRIIGAIETYCQMNDIPSHKQMASTAKGFVTDNKLRKWDFWQPGMKHARDAIRHGCYLLLFYKRGEDIV